MNFPQMAMSDSAVHIYVPTNPVRHQVSSVRSGVLTEVAWGSMRTRKNRGGPRGWYIEML